MADVSIPRPALGRPKDPAKRAAILEAAKQLFAEQGFDGVSMDAIARQAGVSKLTVYSHFGDKDGLLRAVVQAHCDQDLPIEMFEPRPEVPLRERLSDIAAAFYNMATHPEAIAGYRMLCVPQATCGKLADLFWEAGPARIQRDLAALLARRDAAGELRIDDAEQAANHFFALAKGNAHARLLIGLDSGLDPAETRRHLHDVVELFLRAYRP
ncbi:MAG: TetR/AcrR family transcriptional regulator [Pseudomonadota bacterium]|nr:TetR/AcrR family transcriptional regulator [Pseudomonadota bacterium]